VHETQLAQLLGLEDGVGDRAANAGGRGTQGDGSDCINVRLYQSPLMLFAATDGCQPRRRVVEDDGVWRTTDDTVAKRPPKNPGRSPAEQQLLITSLEGQADR
jgi:hypothetical protein